MGAAAAIPLIAQGASTALGVIGTIRQGQAQKQQANYQAAVARNNAIVAEQHAQRAEAVAARNAEDARRRGEQREAQLARETAKLKGRQRAILAANGVVVDQGSALETLADTSRASRLDALTIRSNSEREAAGFQEAGALEAHGLRTQQQNFLNEAELRKSEARNAQTSSFLAAGGTLLTGASKVADKWKAFQRETGNTGSTISRPGRPF